MRLNELSPMPGARKPRKRVGRGIGSGLGKTSGKGHKGQKARSGVATAMFEGGQMPIYMRLPKRGFTNPTRRVYAPFNLDQLQGAIDTGKLNPAEAIDEAMIFEAGLVKRKYDGVRLLARGELTAAVTLRLSGASATAVEAVERAGGKVETTAKRAPAEGGEASVEA